MLEGVDYEDQDEDMERDATVEIKSLIDSL